MASSRGHAFLAFGLQREIDHHDGVLLDDADQEHDADQRDDAEIRAADAQGEQGAHSGRGQRGENREGMDVAFVQHAKHDVDRDQRRQDQQPLIGQGVLKRRAEPWNSACMPAGNVNWSLRRLMTSTASPREAPGARLKESVTTGNWPWWLTVIGTAVNSRWLNALKGVCPVVGNTIEVAGADDTVAAPVLDAAAAAVALALRDAVRPAVADPPAVTPVAAPAVPRGPDVEIVQARRILVKPVFTSSTT